jgi:hypothetical protein
MVNLLLVSIVLFFSIRDGVARNDPMFRFNEHQTITFLSALMLGLTSAVSFFLYLLHKKVVPVSKNALFWLLSAMGFFYLCMDEYFMAHEGMDEMVGSWFGLDIHHLNLDGAVIGFFGLVALGVCVYFRKVIQEYRLIIPFFILGAFGLVGTVTFHFLERIHVYYKVTEESLKLLGVSFFFTGYLVALLDYLDGLRIERAR